VRCHGGLRGRSPDAVFALRLSVTAQGARCVVVDLRLEEVEPMAYRFLLGFAKDNGLRTRDGRIAERTMVAQIQRSGDTE
jgi:hypothetical protein